MVEDNPVMSGIMPAEEEITAIAAQLEEYCKHYSMSFRSHLIEFGPYDIDGDAKLAYYLKRQDGGWCYHKRSWESGPQWWPRRSEIRTLEEVLEKSFGGWGGMF